MAQVSLIDLPSKEPETIEVENASQNTPPPSWEAIINSFSDKELATIRRKLDIRLVVPLGCMYCVSVMDRNNLGFAAITGMVTDLNLVGNRYNMIVLWFFITYVLVQPVATACLRKATPPIFIPTITFIWGMLLIGFGFVERWYQLLPLRVILGLLEGGLLPSAVYLMSCWYVRHELQKRNGLFYALGIFASAFSGILSYGFAQMEGLGGGAEYLGHHVPPSEDDPGAATVIRPGIAGWRWIFIMQGVLTCVVACLGYVLVIDFPEVAAKRRYLIRFLQPREIEFMIARLEQDRDDVRPEK
jgi:MFS family permease